MTLPTNPEGAKLGEEARELASLNEEIISRVCNIPEEDALDDEINHLLTDAALRLGGSNAMMRRLADALTAPPPVGGASVEDVIAALEPVARLIVPTKTQRQCGLLLYPPCRHRTRRSPSRPHPEREGMNAPFAVLFLYLFGAASIGDHALWEARVCFGAGIVICAYKALQRFRP